MKFFVDIDMKDVSRELVEECLQEGLGCHVDVRLAKTVEITVPHNDELIHLNKMLYVAGSTTAYRHSCGSNVFSKWKSAEDGHIYYQCHGCLDELVEGKDDTSHGS